MDVPVDEVPPESLLPTLHELSNLITDRVEETSKGLGQVISCRKGCGACCRQHAPISPAEARLLAAIVQNLPEPARSAITERFGQAVERLRASGIMEQVMNYRQLPKDEIIDMVMAYFKLGIACPFLEDESCSIHPYRPLICREYLVISSPRHCASLDKENIKGLKFPVSIAGTFNEMDGVGRDGVTPYIPLIMALEWTEQHAAEVEYRPGTKWVQDFFEALSGAEIPDPDLPG
jgi:Fe-S-cluster containining protein